MDQAKFTDLLTWLGDGAPSIGWESDQLAQVVAEWVFACGIPIARCGVFVHTLNPNFAGLSFVWRRGKKVVQEPANFDVDETDEYRTSPLVAVLEGGRTVRLRKREIEEDTYSMFLADMRRENITDYIAFPLKFIDASIHSLSWTTQEPDGFSDEHIDALRRLVAPLTRVIEIVVLRHTAVTLLETYVGHRPGERIMKGQIRRGHTEAMEAVIWLSDLRGFTRLSDRLPSDVVVDVLNRYFDCQVAAITAHGGEVLKFMGDGLLAVFPVAEQGRDAVKVCADVMMAVESCCADVGALNYAERGFAVEQFHFALALHVGTVLYGNIGGGNRLDFTCIGPAVNLAARLEALAKKLDRTVVASADFVGYAGGDWTDLGEFPIRGFSQMSRVFGLRAEDEALPRTDTA